MSDLNLLAVLKMPRHLWSEDTLDQRQREAIYGEAAQRIQSDEQKIAALTAQLATLTEFANTVIREFCWGYNAMPGDNLQDYAEKIGLIKTVTYDPAKHGECEYCDPGDAYFELTVPNAIAPLVAESLIAKVRARIAGADANNDDEYAHGRLSLADEIISCAKVQLEQSK